MNKIIFGIETATDACSVAVYKNGQVIGEISVASQVHAQIILDMVGKVCVAAEIDLPQVDYFAFGCGPGSFTGVRIGASVIQGLAFAHNKGVVPISSLAALALQAGERNCPGLILATIDARMNELYYGLYHYHYQDKATKSIVADSLIAPAKLVLPEGPITVVGTGLRAYKKQLEELGADFKFMHDIEYPRAHEVVMLAAQVGTDQVLPAHMALPNYVRNQVVQVANKVDKKNPD